MSSRAADDEPTRLAQVELSEELRQQLWMAFPAQLSAHGLGMAARQVRTVGDLVSFAVRVQRHYEDQLLAQRDLLDGF